jgi:hypothetical protein
MGTVSIPKKAKRTNDRWKATMTHGDEYQYDDALPQWRLSTWRTGLIARCRYGTGTRALVLFAQNAI